MIKIIFKLLTFTMIISVSAKLSADVIQQENLKTHLRWSLLSPKKQLVIEKRNQKVFIRTLNGVFFEKLVKSIKKIKTTGNYISKVEVKSPNNQNNISFIEITLASKDVELFNFYKERERRYVLDFWKEQPDKLVPVVAATGKSAVGKKTAITKRKIKKLPPVLKRKKAVVKKKKKQYKQYRDFRYGAAFIWNYKAFAPKIAKQIDLKTKTPEYFYPIKNRNFKKSDPESHLQLSINLYRKKKWGLMYKSIKLYGQKYGEKNSDINEYLKANAVLRENLRKGNSEPVKMAISMLQNIAAKTKNYDLKKGILKYIINYYREKNENIEVLKLSKRLYVVSRENFDYEESAIVAESIMNSLAKLNQVKKIQAIVKDKTIAKLVPKQVRLAYEMYANHRLGKIDKVIYLYEQEKRNLTKPVHESILFNAGEAYFRSAKYTKAIKLFDSFISQYSYNSKASEARLRIALSYELTNKPIKEVLALYKSAINRSLNNNIGYEARLRYVALRTTRNKKINSSDREVRVFLKIDKKKEKSITKNLKKLLWLVRLRSFIVDEKYSAALAYLNAIPLMMLPASDRRVFEADGAEIVYGLIQNFYNKSEYSKVVKAWSIYRKRFVTKVANDSYMNYIVGQAYLKLGLYSALDELLVDFKKLSKTPNKTFPNWYERKAGSREFLVEELKLYKDIKLENWKQAKASIAKLKRINPKYLKIHYYNGIILRKEKKYFQAAQEFETFLVGEAGASGIDAFEMAELIKDYTDSLYELGETSKFKKVANALLNDTKSVVPKNEYLKNVRERVSYLIIEMLASDNTKQSNLELEVAIINFKKKYKKTTYKGRLSYLLGSTFISNNKVEKGRKILNDILKDKSISNYMKELAKSELSLLSIKERAL